MDPNRHAYKDILEKSGNLIDTDARNIYTEESRPQSRQASEDEAAAVAAAIGYRPRGGSPLVQSQTAPVNLDAAIEDQNLKSPGIVMKSPELQNLDSPEISGSSSSEDEDEGGVPTGASAAGLGLEQGVEPDITNLRSASDESSSFKTESESKDEKAPRTEE